MFRSIYISKIYANFWKRVSKKWDQGCENFGGTRDPRPRTYLIGGTLDSRHETLKMESEARDLYRNWDQRLGIIKIGSRSWDFYQETKKNSSRTRNPRSQISKISIIRSQDPKFQLVSLVLLVIKII